MGGGDILKSNIIFNMVRSVVIGKLDPPLVGPVFLQPPLRLAPGA